QRAPHVDRRGRPISRAKPLSDLPAHGYRGASELQNREASSIKESRHPRVHRQLAPGGERPMSAAKEGTPGGQTGGPVRSRQSADNGPVISSSIADNDD